MNDQTPIVQLDQDITSLIAYIHSLDDFQILENIDGGYDHVGAIITDAILQAGLRYETVVLPRVRRILEQYPQGRTTTGFLLLLHGEGADVIWQWKHPEKPARALALAQFFQTEGIETEADLRDWLLEEENIYRLKQVRGVGDKTADYLKILVGIQTSAVDRHMYAFLANAGIPVSSYRQAKAILDGAADRLGVRRAHFDHSIWEYMSSKACKA
jgi:hypothetical protein